MTRDPIAAQRNALGYAVIDNIRIDATPIPEPAAADLFVAGTVLLARCRRPRA